MKWKRINEMKKETIIIVTNTPTDGCDDCAYLSMDTDGVVNVCPECAEERTQNETHTVT
jgi:hypothetical protein